MRIALIQVASPDTESIEERRRRVSDFVRAAVGADLIVLPELWPAGYFAFDRYAASAETQTGRTVRDAAAWARELRAWVHAGSFVEQAGDNAYRNTAVLIDPAGQTVHHYSKIHVFGYESKEAQLLEPGGHLAVSPTPFGRVASTTCYDLRFPQLWQELVDLGTQIAVVPAAWPKARLHHWRLFTSARAVEEQILVVACNAVGTHGGTELGGSSRVVDPQGRVLIEAGQDEGVVTCEVDPGTVDRVRQEFPVLKDRLPGYAHLRDRLGGR